MRRNQSTTQPTTSMDLTQKILGDLKLDYAGGRFKEDESEHYGV